MTVHAELADGRQIARSDIAGGWWICSRTGRARHRITMQEAVAYAIGARLEHSGHIYLSIPGGIAFDALFRRQLAANEAELELAAA